MHTRQLPKLLLVAALMVLVGVPFLSLNIAQAQGPFLNINVGLTGVTDGDLEWGDYDADGDLDLLVMGSDGNANVTQLWRKDAGNVYANSGVAFTGLTFGDAAWGDYDNDNDLDLLLTGWTGAQRVTQIWQNTGGAFADINAGITGVNSGSADWGDYDNDGDLDVLIAGWTGSQRVTQIWTNDRVNNQFVKLNLAVNITGVENGEARWGDYDSDADLDVMVAGWNGTQRVTQLWRNDENALDQIIFTQVNVTIPGVDSASIAWGDYDNDSDLDIAVVGKTTNSQIAQVWRNDNGTFVQFNTPITGIRDGTSVGWGDYDNDGDFDLIISGRDANNFAITQIWRNDGTFFNNFVVSIPGVTGGATAWGDYDNDGKLDVVVSGFDGANRITQVWRNMNPVVANTPPQPPTNLNANVVGQGALLTWSKSTDNVTPQNGLMYNVRIGTAPGGSDVASAMANGVNGYRFIPAIGNAQANQGIPSYGLTGLQPNTTYYWTVQAIDTAYAGSAFPIGGDFTTPPYQVAPIDITGVASGASTEWGDYDNDNDLDLLISGFDGANRVTQIWRNDGPTNFVQIATGITGVVGGDSAFADFDNDGDLDVAISGQPTTGRVTQIWRNNGNNSFTNINAPITAVSGGKLAWGDYNGDGDIDLIVSGDTGAGRVAQVWKNNGNDQFEKAYDLPGVIDSSFAWGDYDNDGDLDVLMAGLTDQGRVTAVFRNDGNAFTNINAGLTTVSGGEVAFADYDSDGDLDILANGDTGNGPSTNVYRNDNGTFTNINAGITGLQFGSVAWGDYDNDGDLDIVVNGQTGANANDPRETQIWRNDGVAGFTNIGAGLIGISLSDLAFGDYDNDGDLDLVLVGWTGTERVTQIWRNDGGFAPNAPPTAPTIVTAQVTSNSATLIWNPTVDDRTPTLGLSYNVRVGNLPTFPNIVSPMANAATGYRRVAALGNAQDNIGTLSFTVTNLEPNRTYYWSVQAIDNSFAGSGFSAEGTLTTNSGTDALALFNDTTGQTYLYSTIVDNPPAPTQYASGAPINGDWVMGDWNADNVRSPGVFANGAFYYTNDIGNNNNWNALWLGPTGTAIAGRFDANLPNDCIGVVTPGQITANNVTYNVFVMYYTCILNTNVPPISYQWLSAVLPDQGGFTGTHQFAAGDFDKDGVDTVAVRRNTFIAFTNVEPNSNNANHATFDLAQYWGTPPAIVGEGTFVTGDWDNQNLDTFGVLYDNNEFYYRNDVEWNTGIYFNQTLPAAPAAPRSVVSWTPGGSSNPIIVSSTLQGVDGLTSLDGDGDGNGDEDEQPTITELAPLDGGGSELGTLP